MPDPFYYDEWPEMPDFGQALVFPERPSKAGKGGGGRGVGGKSGARRRPKAKDDPIARIKAAQDAKHAAIQEQIRKKITYGPLPPYAKESGILNDVDIPDEYKNPELRQYGGASLNIHDLDADQLAVLGFSTDDIVAIMKLRKQPASPSDVAGK
jgi:hypothetical protein